MTTNERDFLQSRSFAVAGASNDRDKYGNLVFRALLDFVGDDPDRVVYAINPKEEQIETHRAFANLAALPIVPAGLSIITPPEITRRIIDEAIAAGVKQIWIQPGAEHPGAIQAAKEAGAIVIADGPCILVALKTLV